MGWTVKMLASFPWEAWKHFLRNNLSLSLSFPGSDYGHIKRPFYSMILVELWIIVSYSSSINLLANVNCAHVKSLVVLLLGLFLDLFTSFNFLSIMGDSFGIQEEGGMGIFHFVQCLKLEFWLVSHCSEVLAMDATFFVKMIYRNAYIVVHYKEF